MELVQIVKKETAPVNQEAGKIYSAKLGKYIPINAENPKGDIQRYNLGMGPGSWY